MPSSLISTRRGILAGALLLGCGRALAQKPAVPVGVSDYVASVIIGASHYNMRVFANVPLSGVMGKPVLFVMHGVQRDADRYRDEWRMLSDRYGVVVLVPEFSEANFPKRENYNFGGMVARDGTMKPRGLWHWQVIEQIFKEFRSRSGSDASGFDLFGHSAGAQFAHRYALFEASPLAQRIISANAGSYSMPVMGKQFPWGIGGVGLGNTDLKDFLVRDGILMLGDADTDPKHKSLPRDPEAQGQGPHRLARGEAFYAALEAAAAAQCVKLGWTKVLVPGVAHDNAGMGAAAAKLLYDKPMR
jgi:hypothetical protein